MNAAITKFVLLEETSLLARVQPEGKEIAFWVPKAELEVQADGSAIRTKQPRIKRFVRRKKKSVGLVDKQPKLAPTFIND